LSDVFTGLGRRPRRRTPQTSTMLLRCRGVLPLVRRAGASLASPALRTAPCARPAGLRHLCTHPSTSAVDGSSPSAEGASSAALSNALGMEVNHSSRSRRTRLEAALDACRRGEPFQIPPPEPKGIGPVGATFAVLKEAGPLRLQPLYDALEEKFPGVVASKTHLRNRILRAALVHKVMMVRGEDSRFKDAWAIRRQGQIRTAIARGRKTRPVTTAGKAASIRKLTRRGKADWRPNERGPGPRSKKMLRRIKWQ
jgi:hypothetical protein